MRRAWVSLLLAATASAQQADGPAWATSMLRLEPSNHTETGVAPAAASNDDTADFRVLSTQIYELNALPPDADTEACRDELERALVEVRRAQDLARAGRWADAVAALTPSAATAQFKQTQAQLYPRIGAYYFQMRDFTNAIRYMRLARIAHPMDRMGDCNLAAALIGAGEYDEALSILKSVDPETAPNRRTKFSALFNLACLYSLQGNPDQAFNALGRAAREDPTSTLSFLSDEQLRNIRSDPRFKDIKSGLQDYLATPAGP